MGDIKKDNQPHSTEVDSCSSGSVAKLCDGSVSRYRRRIETSSGNNRFYSYVSSPVVFTSYPEFVNAGNDLSVVLRDIGKDGCPCVFRFNVSKKFLDFVRKQVAFRNRDGVGDKVGFDVKYVVKPPHGSWYVVTIYKKKLREEGCLR